MHTVSRQVDRSVKHALPKIDGRTRVAQRLKLTLADLRNEHPDAPEKAVVRAAELVTAAEVMRGKVLRGDHVSVDQMIRVENAATRAVTALDEASARPQDDADDDALALVQA